MTPTPAPFARDEMLRMLPVTLSDLKRSSVPAERVRNNANIRRSLYKYVIHELYSEDRFRHVERVAKNRVGMLIKGSAWDVWAYLGQAYDLIHGTDFEQDFPDLIRSVV